MPTYLENMKRILKKSPPSRTNILMLYNFETLDQYVPHHHLPHAPAPPHTHTRCTADSCICRERDQFVADLFPSPNNGHIYIGFSTHQTTGSGFHIAAQVRAHDPTS